MLRLKRCFYILDHLFLPGLMLFQAMASCSSREPVVPGKETPGGDSDGLVHKIVFIAVDEKDQHQLYTINDDGTDLRLIFEHDSEIGDVRVSPNGQQIVFYANNATPPSANYQLYICNIDGTELKQVTHLKGNCYEAQWFPEGKELIFEYLGELSGGKIYRIDADGTNLQKISKKDEDSYRLPNLSPDGQKIAFEKIGPTQIWSMRSDGSEEKLLSEANAKDDQWPIWTRDSKKIVYVNREWDLCIMDGNGLNKKVLYKRSLGRQDVSPADGRIVFNSTEGLYIIHPDGTGLERLTDVPAQGYPVLWSPDGNKVAFVGDADGDGKISICVVNKNGSKLREIVSLNVNVHFMGANRQLAWVP